MDKKKLHHYLTVVRRLKTWQLVILLILSAFVSATLLRMNNLGMIERREAVLQADEKGDQVETKKALTELQNYVSSHMNTSLGGGLYLEHSYNRARDAALERANNSTNPASEAYQQASIECRSRFVGGTESFRNDYVQCVLEKVGSMSQGQDPFSLLQLPRADLFKYDFVSPRWTPDLAGFAVLFTLLIAVIIVLRLLFIAVVRMLLKHHFRTFNS